MSKKLSNKGFGAAELLVAIVVIAVLGFGGWLVWHNHQAKKVVDTTKSQAHTKTGTPTADPYAGWTWYENRDLGFKFAYPKSWTVDQPRTVATAAGDQGWTVDAKAISPQNGDPVVAFSTYPADATIRNVDAGPSDVKVRDVTMADKSTFSLIGIVEDSSKVTKPSQMYASICWPRNCLPKLANGRYLEINVGSTNNDCDPKALCPTEINVAGANYGLFIRVLESIKPI